MTLPSLAWYWPVIGGLMIGTAAGGFLLLTGRIAGVSGLLANTLGLSSAGDRSLSALFLAGLLVASGLALAVKPISLPSLSISATPLLVLAGLLSALEPASDLAARAVTAFAAWPGCHHAPWLPRAFSCSWAWRPWRLSA